MSRIPGFLQYVVMRVNGSNLDTHAALDHRQAYDLANPDPTDTVEWTLVEASDAGMARCIPTYRERRGEVTIWQTYSPPKVRRLS